MPAGICSVVKSKPRRVQRCISNGSLDVKGSVVVERVWLADGDSLPADHLPVSNDGGCLGSRNSHQWSLYTNLSSAQQCVKCDKRILLRRAAYKCTACKKLAHLKCAVSDPPVATRTRSKIKSTDRGYLAAKTCLKEGGNSQNLGTTPDRNEGAQEKPFHVGESDSLTEFIMEEEKCNTDSTPQALNRTAQSQARQTLSNMKNNIVRHCSSIKKKVEKLRDKLNCDCQEKTNNDIVPGQDIETAIDCADEETGVTVQDAWLSSPIRKRLRSRLGDDNGSQSEEQKTDWFSYRRNKRRRFDAYAIELTEMNERLEVVEKKISDLEQSIPMEIEEWRKLHKKYQINDREAHINTGREVTVDDETTMKVPLFENIPSSISVVADAPDSTAPLSESRRQDDKYRPGPAWKKPTAEVSGREESFPSAIPPRLFIGEQCDSSGSYTELQQTSTPVTNKEISFRSANKKHELSQITHRNITHIRMDSKEVKTDNKAVHDLEVVTEPSTLNDKKVLSPNQIAVKSFLERRRSTNTESKNQSFNAESESQSGATVLSPNQIAVQQFLERRKSNPLKFHNSNRQSNRVENIDTEEEATGMSPTSNIASSTFTNGNDDIINPLFNMSPIPYTCKNGFENGSISFSRSSEESKTNGKKTSGLDRSAFNMSAFSYTFRNDSSMFHTDGNENLPGFSDNVPRLRPEASPVSYCNVGSNFDMVHHVTVAHCSTTPAAAGSTTDGLSLTNVTEVSPDCPNSFTDCKDAMQIIGNKIETSSSRFSDEFLSQIKSGVKLRETSLESKMGQEQISVDHSIDHMFEDSELKIVYDKIVRDRHIKQKNKESVNTPFNKLKIDETGDNGHYDSFRRKGPLCKRGSKYHDLFKFCEPEGWGIVVSQCKAPSVSSEKHCANNRVLKQGPQLTPKPAKSNDTTFERDIKKEIPTFSLETSYSKDKEAGMGRDIGETETEKDQMIDAAGDKNMAMLEINEIKNISETKSETFPRTAKKQYYTNHLGASAKAASYTDGIDIDRRSVYTETSSLDRYGDAKYHFLHEKGMIKICSPRLELVSESPSAKRRCQLTGNNDNHISEEDTNMEGSSSEISGVVIDNEFHLNGHMQQRLNEFNDLAEHLELLHKDKKKLLQDDNHVNQTLESYNSEIQARQQDLANEILENCLEIIDNNQAALDHVFDWINKDHQNNSDTSVKAELDALLGTESQAQAEQESGFQSPVEESLYYSFQGQSEEIRKIMTCLEMEQTKEEDQKLKDFLVAVMNENLDGVMKFLTSEIIIPDAVLKESLNFATQQQNQSISKELLDYACKLLFNREMNNIVYVWPAFIVEEEWNPVFVVIWKSHTEDVWGEFLGYRVYNRVYDEVSEEANIVMKSDLVRSNPLTFDDFGKLKVAVNSISQMNHSNITLVDICTCRSRKEGKEIFLETCIVIYCLVKGLIPFGEKSFPKTVQGIPVDVREGYFSPGVQRARHRLRQTDTECCTEVTDSSESSVTGEEGDSSSSLASGTEEDKNAAEELSEETDGREEQINLERNEDVCGQGEHVEIDYSLEPEYTENITQEAYKAVSQNSLRMGATICGADSSRTGTLGGFVPLGDNQMGFLTCVHVLGSDIGSSVFVVEDLSLTVCGTVTKFVSQSGSSDSTGLDVALVTVTPGTPVTVDFGRLTNKQLLAAGFNNASLPKFQTGKILTLQELDQYWKSKVIKVGAKTGLTMGTLYSNGIYVKKTHNRKDKQSTELYSQLEVMPDSKLEKFFDLGDSGALVFMHLNDQDLYCIGLAVGCTSYGSCIVTPIEQVFKELQLTAQFHCCET